MEILGLSGYARSGKDEAAKTLEEYGYVRVAFADKLREFIYALNPRVADRIRVADVIQQYGWHGYKETPYGAEIRALLQKLGTECGRGLLGESIWVDSTLNPLDPNGKYVITDCRFPNEAQAVERRGGKMYRITRNGVGPANDHSSETSLDDWQFEAYIANDSDLETFRNNVRATIGLTHPGQLG